MPKYFAAEFQGLGDLSAEDEQQGCQIEVEVRRQEVPVFVSVVGTVTQNGRRNRRCQSFAVERCNNLILCFQVYNKQLVKWAKVLKCYIIYAILYTLYYIRYTIYVILYTLYYICIYIYSMLYIGDTREKIVYL